ncbi:hypothetical protein PIB30_105365 [Stylosanthes scabra]|uniref:Uncharacterized protein n=1 Tax=Stylosanthes scabra TaxID=79078 RepID=A0ABU6UXP0_9FABA|nr:hypothetical protein [Stylosanthes scabra]
MKSNPRPSNSVTLRRESQQDPRIGVKLQAYAWKVHPRPRCNVSLTRSLVSLLLDPLLTWSTLITTPRTSLVTHSLTPTSRVTTNHAYAWWISHPRICVENILLAANTRPTHRRESPHIGVKVHAYAWKARSSHIPGSVIHAYA